MTFFTVTEHWTDPVTKQFLKHTNEFRMRLHFKLDDMQAAGEFVRNPITGDRSVYGSDGSPTKIFTTREAADEYEAWVRKEYTPHEFEIREWADWDAVVAYLHQVRDPDHKADQGPTDEQKRLYRQQLGLDSVDKE